MTMRFTQLVTHWEPDEALSIIEFIEQLKEMLIATYGEDIQQQMQQEYRLDHITDEEQLNLGFDDKIPF